MMTQLKSLQVRFATSVAYRPSPDPSGVGHEPWTQPPWTFLPRALRALRPGLVLHHSVVDRIKSGLIKVESVQARYVPQNLTSYVANGGLAKPGVAIA